MQKYIDTVKEFFLLNKQEKQILTSVVLSALIIMATVTTALSIEVENQGVNYQTSTYKFEFLGSVR